MTSVATLMLAASSSLVWSVVLKVTATTLLALAAAKLAHRSRAAFRHVLLAASFAVLTVLPFAALVAPAIRVPVAMAQPAATLETAVVPGVTELPAAATAGSEVTTSSGFAISPTSVLMAAWIVGTALCVAPIVIGLWQVGRLRRSALPWTNGRPLVDQLTRDAGIRRRVDVLLHETAPGPMTFGVFRPTIVLPLDARAWKTEDLVRAIVHELEHVRRGDWATQCLARIACAFYWFHPLVWIARQQLALEAERACDDAVVSRSDATAYADQLVDLAERLTVARHQPLLAMANRSDLAARVTAVLDARQARGRAGAIAVTAACAIALALISTISPLQIVAAVQQVTAPAGTSQRYDVASIKKCTGSDVPQGPARGTAGGTNATFSPGRFYVPCVSVEQLIYLAYAAYGVNPDEHLANDEAGGASDSKKVRGGPDWVHSRSEAYSIEASAAGATERTVLMGSMLRGLLEDRFRLKIHRETEEVPMYALVVGKNGFKLKPMNEGDCDPMQSPGTGKPKCSSINMSRNGPNTVWTYGGMPVSSLASMLSSTLDRHVIDRTGLTDKFVYRLEFSPDENTPKLVQREIDYPPDPGPRGPGILTALDQQLGLRIESVKAPHGYLVIDHIERPTFAPAFAGATVGKPTPPARAAGPGKR
ncbi:MAG TPA: M56 family metallopeptidase [Vicinamibacterales bacterium]|nr:M56 family metallopeptidase [Vicinamibacterales bacterium]